MRALYQSKIGLGLMDKGCILMIFFWQVLVSCSLQHSIISLPLSLTHAHIHLTYLDISWILVNFINLGYLDTSNYVNDTFSILLNSRVCVYCITPIWMQGQRNSCRASLKSRAGKWIHPNLLKILKNLFVCLRHDILLPKHYAKLWYYFNFGLGVCYPWIWILAIDLSIKLIFHLSVDMFEFFCYIVLHLLRKF